MATSSLRHDCSVDIPPGSASSSKSKSWWAKRLGQSLDRRLGCFWDLQLPVKILQSYRHEPASIMTLYAWVHPINVCMQSQIPSVLLVLHGARDLCSVDVPSLSLPVARGRKYSFPLLHPPMNRAVLQPQPASTYLQLRAKVAGICQAHRRSRQLSCTGCAGPPGLGSSAGLQGRLLHAEAYVTHLNESQT